MTQYRLLVVLAAMAAACSKTPQQAQPNQGPETAPASGLIGKWCYKPSAVPSTWDLIEISKATVYTLVDHFGDGSTRSSALEAKVDGLWERDSNSGDHYVLPSQKGGDLVIADNDGEVGRATALADTAKPADCFQS